MARDTRVVWDESAIRLYCDRGRGQEGMARLAGMAVVAMKAACPVSPVQPTYASPIPAGASKGPVYRGRGLARPGGPAVDRLRYPGDLPLRPSGYLRNSIKAFRLPGGDFVIGPTADYGKFVNDGTPPHGIDSTGPWPLRNRATGQVFGPHVNHPGTKGAHFIERAAFSLRGVRIHLG